MGPHVEIQLVDGVERLTAMFATDELFRIFVMRCVRFEIFDRLELFRTANTLETFLLRVDHHVPLEVILVVETFRAHFAGKALVSLVSFLVNLHV